MTETVSNIQIICLESDAFHALIDEVLERVKVEQSIKTDKWIDEHEAMAMLRVSSKTTLQKYRDERRIGFSQASRKIILYDRDSIIAYLNKNMIKPLS